MSVWCDTTTERGVVSVDWFSISCLLIKERKECKWVPPSGWYLLQQNATAVWSERWFLLDSDGNKVATILCVPRSPIIDCKRCVIEIANRWLYYDDCKSLIDKVLDMVGVVVTGMNRVDLCCDFEMSKERWDTYCRLNDGTASVKGYSMNNVWRQKLRDKDAGFKEKRMWVPHDLNWGSPESTFKWKIYYKWLELKQAPPEGKKPYIVDLWRQMGFNEKYVWRIEVSVKGCNRLNTAQKMRLPPMEWYNDRVRLFQSIYADKFVVREEGGHADHRNDRILPFLDIKGEKMLWHALPSSGRDDSDPERRLTCKLWKELQQPDTRCNKMLTDVIKQSLCELLQRPNNVWVLQRMYGVEFEDITKALAE